MDASTLKYIEKEESVRRVEDYFQEIGCTFADHDPVGSLIESHRRLRDMNRETSRKYREFQNKYRFLPFRVRMWIWNKVL